MPNSPDMPESYQPFNPAFVLFAIALFLSLLFYSIPLEGLRPSQKEAVQIYYADNISQAHESIIDSFNAKYSGQIEVIPVNLPFDLFNTNERKELIARVLRSRGSKMDVFAVDQVWVPRFTKWAEPLTRFFPNVALSNVLPDALKTCYTKQQLVSVPLYIDIGLLYYRRDILEALPHFSQIETDLLASMTWKEFIALRDRYFADEPFYIFPGDNYEGLICNFLETFGGDGDSIYKDENFEINNSASRASIQLMHDLINKYGITPEAVISFDDNESYAYAFEHNIPFFRGWPSSLAEFHANPAYAEIARNLGIAALPHIDGHDPASVFGGWNLMISKFSKHKEEASLFLKYMLSEEAQDILYQLGGYPPILSDRYRDELYTQKHPTLQYLGALMKHGIHRPHHEDYTQISDILSIQINEVLAQKTSITNALETAVQELQSRGIPAR